MPNLDRPISEFPRALEVLATALVLISNPSGIDSYDSYSCTLTELGKTILDVEYTQELGQVSVFEAIVNLRVLSGTGDPSSSLGVDNQIYVKYQTVGGVDSVTAIYIKLNGTWVEISTGGGGGTSVTLGTTVPSDATGSNGDLYVQYDSVTYAVIEYFVKINNSWRKSPYSRVVALTQAEYDLITPDPTTLYIITDAQSSYQTKTDNSLATTDKTVVGAINELKSDSEYHVGDTINISNLQLTGLITSGQKSIYIQLPLPKAIGNDVNTITLNANALFYIRHVTGGYIINNQTLTSIGTVTLKKNLTGIFIGVDMTNAFTGCPNNAPLVVSTGEGANDYITFS